MFNFCPYVVPVHSKNVKNLLYILTFLRQFLKKKTKKYNIKIAKF